MPRISLWLLFLLISTSVFSQQTQINRSPPSVIAGDARLYPYLNLYLPRGPVLTLFNGVDSVGALFFRTTDNTLWIRASSPTGNIWQLQSSQGGSADSFFNGNRPITRDFKTVTGINLGTTTTKATIAELLYPAQPPVATLTGGVQLEFMSAGGSLPYVLSWSAARQSTTATLANIVVAGVNQVFTQPSQGGVVSGTQSVSIPRNVTTTFSNSTTTTDGKSSLATTAFTFSSKRYFGWVNSTLPSDADILANTSEFYTNKTKTWIQGQPVGDQNLFYAYPAIEGPLTEITVNGFPAIQSFELAQRTLMNASGFSSQYNIYVSTNKFSITGNTSVSVQ